MGPLPLNIGKINRLAPAHMLAVCVVQCTLCTECELVQVVCTTDAAPIYIERTRICMAEHMALGDKCSSLSNHHLPINKPSICSIMTSVMDSVSTFSSTPFSSCSLAILSSKLNKISLLLCVKRIPLTARIQIQIQCHINK